MELAITWLNEITDKCELIPPSMLWHHSNAQGLEGGVKTVLRDFFLLSSDISYILDTKTTTSEFESYVSRIPRLRLMVSQ